MQSRVLLRCPTPLHILHFEFCPFITYLESASVQCSISTQGQHASRGVVLTEWRGHSYSPAAVKPG